MSQVDNKFMHLLKTHLATALVLAAIGLFVLLTSALFKANQPGQEQTKELIIHLMTVVIGLIPLTIIYYLERFVGTTTALKKKLDATSYKVERITSRLGIQEGGQDAASMERSLTILSNVLEHNMSGGFGTLLHKTMRSKDSEFRTKVVELFFGSEHVVSDVPPDVYLRILKELAEGCTSYRTIQKNSLSWFFDKSGINFLSELGSIAHLQQPNVAYRIFVLTREESEKMDKDIQDPKYAEAYRAACGPWTSRRVVEDDLREEILDEDTLVWHRDVVLLDDVLEITYDEKSRQLTWRGVYHNDPTVTFFRRVKEYETAMSTRSKIISVL
ncbi:MAG: hypothetical protein KF784_08175 [Fimbriimonadaceae bacterium]|nr:hypothetical protein [Fimbriimonadaceae bacterium]